MKRTIFSILLFTSTALSAAPGRIDILPVRKLSGDGGFPVVSGRQGQGAEDPAALTPCSLGIIRIRTGDPE